MAQQSYATHRMFVPGYHFGVSLGLVINFGWSLYRLVQSFTGDNIVGVILGAALVGLYIYTRTFPLRVQDRVIRLEMLVRLRDVLPAAMHPRIREFRIGQLIAMRFASDEELPALAARVLQDDIHNQNVIKKLVTNWQADGHRV